MERTTWQQIQHLIESEANILIALPRSPSTDAIASSLALYSFLEKTGKRPKVVANNFHLPPNHQFLPKSKEIYADLASLQKFTISLNVAKTKVEELSYDITGDALNIFITPKSGYFTQKDVTTSAGAYEYSLIVVLDAPDLEALGALFDDNAEFFYNTPIINIDHRATNTHFGQVNLVELTATSTSEILFELMREVNPALLDEYIATNLLAGIISKTKSFQTATVTPKSLSIASHLIASGARRDEIIRHLYQTKTLPTLRLWGRALARLKTDCQDRYVFSRVTQLDFERAESRADDLAGVIDELIVNTPKAEVIAVLYEAENGKVEAVVHTTHALNSATLFRDFHPEGSRDFTKLVFPTKLLDEAEGELGAVVQKHYSAT